MNPIFAAHAAAIFDGPLSVVATYTPATGAPLPIRVIPSIGDQALSFASTSFVAGSGVFLVQVASVPAPAEGDVIAIADVGEFRVQGRPERHERRLWWRVEAKPL